MKILTESEVLDLLADGYSQEEIDKGYGEFFCTGNELIIDGALIIEKIDAVNKFEDDWEASRQAEKDGVKFINDIEGLEKGCYVDTPENRKLCIDMLEKYPEYKVETLMHKCNNEYWEIYKNYFNIA